MLEIISFSAPNPEPPGSASSISSPAGQTINPTGPSSGLERVIRGGSWAGSIDYVRGFYRNKSQPQIRYRDGGIRLVRNF